MSNEEKYNNKFLEGLSLLSPDGFAKPEDWFYAGGNSNHRPSEIDYHDTNTINMRHYNNYKRMYGEDAKLPPHEDHCICGQAIIENCYIHHKSDKDIILVVGNTCILKHLPPENRQKKCDRCEGPHKNRKDNYCNECRIIIMEEEEIEEKIEEKRKEMERKEEQEERRKIDYSIYLARKKESERIENEKITSQNLLLYKFWEAKYPKNQESEVFFEYLIYTMRQHERESIFFNFFEEKRKETFYQYCKNVTLCSECGCEYNNLVDRFCVKCHTKIYAFGKYAGKSYEEILNRDKGYCLWVICEYETSGSYTLKDFAIWLNAIFSSNEKKIQEMIDNKQLKQTQDQVLEEKI